MKASAAAIAFVATLVAPLSSALAQTPGDSPHEPQQGGNAGAHPRRSGPSKDPDAREARGVPSAANAANDDGASTRENPLDNYVFAGLRYRGTIVPQFLVNAFANGGATFYSHMVGAELDVRKDGHSTMPWIAFASYGFGDTLFEQNTTVNGQTTGPELAGNWTVASSTMNALYLGLDELWSAPLDDDQHWAFEYGFGVGLGVIFGTLTNDWVTPLNPQAPIAPGNYKECQTVNDGLGCSPADHQNATVNKVAGYSEPSGLLGPKPILFPYLAVPQIGLRYKPVPSIESRLGVGFSLTGFWFGLSVDYGLTKTAEAKRSSMRGPLDRATF